MNDFMRISIVGTNSGCGKTTTVLAIEGALLKRGLPITAFKCGPDYIDGSFHRRFQHINCYNLDSIFLDDEDLKAHFVKHAKNKFSIIEGVMGMFDGVGYEEKGSSNKISQTIESPTILVINARGMSSSVRALIRGFKDYSNNTLSGVIFTNISSMIYPMLKKNCQLEGLKCYGYIPFDEKIKLESRNLGLVGSREIDNLNEKLDYLSILAEKYIELDEIIELGKSATQLKIKENNLLINQKKKEDKLKIAIAQDIAFCFTYQENLEMMQEAGFELIYFSPLKDKKLPNDISALYLPGGYPELHLKELSSNKTLLNDIKLKIKSGMPTLAECGGFLYLHKCVDEQKLVGLFDGSCKKTTKLQHFGYGRLKCLENNLLLNKGESLLVHEFHYYKSTNEGSSCIETKLSSGKQHNCVVSSSSLFASFSHLYFPANPILLDRLKNKMRKYHMEMN